MGEVSLHSVESMTPEERAENLERWEIRKAEIVKEKREQDRETDVTLTNGRESLTMNKITYVTGFLLCSMSSATVWRGTG